MKAGSLPCSIGFLVVYISVVLVFLVRPRPAFAPLHNGLPSTGGHAAIGTLLRCGRFADGRQELWQLDDLICRYLAYAQKLGGFATIQERECLIWRSSVEGLALNAIDMGENQVVCALRKPNFFHLQKYTVIGILLP